MYDALKREVFARGDVAGTWVTKTHCLGICPARGATVAVHPAPPGGAIVTEVEATDATALLAPWDTSDARAPGSDAQREERRETRDETGAAVRWEDLDRELDAVVELQTSKVLDLARRLKPGLTLEDVQNPHDFPELDDADWHYADGILTGMKSVSSALRAMARRAPNDDLRAAAWADDHGEEA